MTPEQQQLIAALNRCTLAPGSWDKRFARSLERLAADTELSEKQVTQLERMRERYRRQLARIAPALVADLPPIPTKKQPAKNEAELLRAWNAGEPIRGRTR